jgi:hypothetical protein
MTSFWLLTNFASVAQQFASAWAAANASNSCRAGNKEKPSKTLLWGTPASGM